MLKDLGHDLEIFRIYESTFAENSQMGNELMDIFVEIITFWTQAIYFLRRNRHSTVNSQAWPQVHRKFEESSKRIKKRCQQIKEKVAALMAVDSQRPAVLLKELDRLGLISLSGNVASVPENKSLFPCDNIPFTPNPHFLGRQEELNHIRSHFGDLLTSKTFCSFALYGTGGIGKTQTALSYTHEQVARGISAVLWLNCETGLSLAQSFYEVADILQLEGISEDINPNQNRFLVLKWLRKISVPWLVVMDNVESLPLIRNAWPVASHGAVLVTSRNSIVSIDPAAAGMEIRVLRDESGADLLTNLIGRAEYSEQERHSACLLSARLGGLPSALAVMASQIRLRGRSITDFLTLYEKHSRQLNKEKRGIEAYYSRSLETCWQTAFEYLTDDARKLMEIIAHVGPDHIPEALVKQNNLPEDFCFCGDDWAFTEALEQLLSMSLVRQDVDRNMLYIHRLIQEEFRNWIGRDGRYVAFRSTSQLLNIAFPKLINGLSMRPVWPECKLYAAHVLILCARYEEDRYEPKAEDKFEAFLQLSTSIGWYLMECGAWEEELELMRTAMRLCTDKEGLVYANLANSLGGMECERGHIEAAHEYMDKRLEIRRRLLPPNHEEVANGLNNYGNIILQNLDTGDCEKALKYYEECIRINMQCSESHNRKFLHIPHTNIARLLRVTKDYAGSIRHAELSRKYSIDFLGPGNHFDGLADYHVGNAHYDQGLYDDAERHWKQALSCFTQESETHPTTIAAKLKLSCIAIKRKQYDIAINDLSKILIIAQLNESSKGDKGETARALRKLAEAYELNGDQEQGSNYKLQAETIRKQIQGARFEKLPDEDQSYAMMSFHAFW